MGEQFTPVCKEVKFMILCKSEQVDRISFKGCENVMSSSSSSFFFSIFAFSRSFTVFDHFIFCSWMTCIVLHVDI